MSRTSRTARGERSNFSPLYSWLSLKVQRRQGKTQAGLSAPELFTLLVGIAALAAVVGREEPYSETV
jgi:hypothetical protein